MKIVLVGGYNLPSQGGIENYVLNLAKELYNKGHEIYVIGRGSLDKTFSIDGIHLIQLSIKENLIAILTHNILASWYIFNHLSNVDLVNYQSIFLPILYEWIPRLKGIQVIHTLHSFAQDNPKYSAKLKWMISALYRLSGAVYPIITVSEHNKGLIRERLKKNATVINCGVHLPRTTLESDILERFNLKEGDFYLTIGRIDLVKNLHLLIKAFLRHSKDNPIKLVICGNMNTPYGKELYALASGDDRVVFPGVVAGSDKEALLNACKAYCLVSSSEGFPIALLEAMAHENICICSDITACKEVLSDLLGLWCKVGDECAIWENMQLIESSPESYHDLNRQVRKRVEENFTWDKISDQYLKYLEENIFPAKK